MIYSFPKILALGTPWISSILSAEVEVSEKIDGSQFIFGKVNGDVYMGSKRKQLFFSDHEKMFTKAVDYIDSIKDKLLEGYIFYSEFLNKPKHNTLAYERTPKNGLYLFGVQALHGGFMGGEALDQFAAMLDIDPPNYLFLGMVNAYDDLLPMMQKDSCLGGKIEGLVVKNYQQQLLLGGAVIPIMSGKYVSEEFKEVNRKNWKEHNNPGRWDAFKSTYRTEARWMKAVQHLREEGELTQEPKDIGNLIKEVNRDIEQEEKEVIKDFLWKHFGKEVLRASTHGLPEFYKEQLLLGNI